MNAFPVAALAEFYDGVGTPYHNFPFLPRAHEPRVWPCIVLLARCGVAAIFIIGELLEAASDFAE